MQLPAQLLKRDPDAHKKSCGYVLVLGGSPGLTGAVCLCAQAALRSGAGLVKAAISESLNFIFEVKLTEVMTLPLPDKRGYLSCKGFNEIKRNLTKADVLVAGPGAGMHLATQKLILKVIKDVNKPLVLDADAINALSSRPDILKKQNNNIILTPHLGEFSRLTKIKVSQIKRKRKELVKEFALRYNLTLVLKGRNTLVTNGREVFENETGSPALATAGTGDVLSGLIAGFIAQGVSSFLAAKVAVYLHGLAADLAEKEKTQSCLIASDLIDYLPQAIRASLNRADGKLA